MDDGLVFSIEEWLGADGGDVPDRLTTAALGILLGKESLTRLEDLSAKTVRQTARVSAYRLAYWLAEHWWRLRWEPEPRASRPDWDMSHRLPAAGGGYVWPNLRFASDGVTMQVNSRVTRFATDLSPVRYLTELTDGVVSAAQFETAVDAFVETVVQRLAELNQRDTDLAELWAEVRRERADPALACQRRREALLGLDPDEADPQLLERLSQAANKLGSQAVDEIAAAATHAQVLPVLEVILEARAEASQATAVRFDADARTALQHLLAEPGMRGLPPWQIGELLAAGARRLWGLGPGPIDNARLGGIVGAPAALFDGPAGPTLPTVLDAAAFRDSHRPERFGLSIRSPMLENRRFHFARLLVDQAVAEDGERLLPAAATQTSRQKLQRAFAAQLLCPYDELRAMLPTPIAQDDVSEAAKGFEVSPLLVRSMLVNKGDLDRSSFSPF